MLAHFAHDLATRYGDATTVDAETCAALAAFASGLTPAVLGNPFALASRLAAADFGEEAVAWGRDTPNRRDCADALRDVLAPVARDAARFYRAQLPLPLPCPFEVIPMPETPAPAAPLLPPVGHDDAQYARPMAAPGLVSYRLRGRYGFIAIGALSAADAMRQAARSTPAPDRAALQVWCDEAGAYVYAATDASEGAPVTKAEFWRVYAAHAAGMYAAGTLPPPPLYAGASPLPSPRELAAALVGSMRSYIDRGRDIATDGPALRATLRTFGEKSRTRAAALAFIAGLAS